MPNGTAESWHLSKSVPITLIFALLMQAGVFIWTISDMASTLNHLIDSDQRQNKEISILEIRVHDTDVKIGRIEVLLGQIDEKIDYLRKAKDIQ